MKLVQPARHDLYASNRHDAAKAVKRLSFLFQPPGCSPSPLTGNAVKYFDKQKNSKIKTSQIAIQA